MSSMKDDIAAAVGESGFLDDEDGVDPFASLQDDEGSPASSEDGASTGDGQNDEGAAEGETPQLTDEELPDSYWGTSLEGLSPEQKRVVIAALEQRDSTIQKLQAELTKAPEPEPAGDDTPDVEPTDDDILAAIGFDPETTDPFELEQARKLSLPLAKQVIALEEAVEKLTTTEVGRSTEHVWNSELDRLEAEYGPLPGDRDTVLKYAARENVPNPEVLYFRLTAPAKKAVEAEIAKAKAKQGLKTAVKGQVRPRSTEAGKKVLNTEGLSLRDTVLLAAKEAQSETGKQWSDILKGQ